MRTTPNASYVYIVDTRPKVHTSFFERFPFVGKGQSDHYCHYENFTFNQNYPARSVNSKMICMELVGILVRAVKKAIFQFLKKLFELASSDF